MKSKILLTTLAISLLVILACRKEIVRVFEIQTQQISSTQINKQTMKAELEFISMAYSDMFGKSIPATTLNNTVWCYAGSNDKALMTDRIIRSYLNSPSANLPSTNEMNDNPEVFITNTYKRFYHRNPDAMEIYQWKQMIKNDPKLLPSTIYYAFLTSNEYRYK